MEASDYENIKKLSVERGIKPALEALFDDHHHPSETLRLHAQLLMGRLNRLEEKQITGTVDPRDYQLEENRIQLALIELLSMADEKRKTQRVWQALLSVVIFLSVLSSGIWMLSLPKHDIEVSFSDFQASRVELKFSKVANLYLGQKVEALSLYNFEDIVLEADTVVGNEVNPFTEIDLLRIAPLPDIASVSLHLGAVSLESLNFEDSAQVVIAQVEGAPGRFRIQVQQSRPISGRLNYAGSLAMSSAYVNIEAAGRNTEYYEPLNWTLLGPENEAREIRFSGDPANFIFEFTLRDSIVEKELLVRELAFFQPEQQQVKSSVMGGVLRLRETDRSPLKTIRLRDGDRIDLEPANNLLVRRLSLRPQGLFLEAGGKLRTLHTYESGERHLRNPSRLAWLWHNQQLVFIGASLLLLGLLYFVVSRVSSRLIPMLNHLNLRKTTSS